MADIFISYKREDLERAVLIAETLQACGFAVFFDPQIAVGERWDRIIESELAAAAAVLVLWSPLSRESDWVRSEAREGKRRGALFPAIIEECILPIEFSAVQTADLRDFVPPTPHPEWERLLLALRAKIPERKTNGEAAPDFVDATPRTAILAAPAEREQEPDSVENSPFEISPTVLELYRELGIKPLRKE